MSGVKKKLSDSQKRKIRKEKEYNINSKYAKLDNFLISASSSSCASASSNNATELDEQSQAHPGIHKRRICSVAATKACKCTRSRVTPSVEENIVRFKSCMYDNQTSLFPSPNIFFLLIRLGGSKEISSPSHKLLAYVKASSTNRPPPPVLLLIGSVKHVLFEHIDVYLVPLFANNFEHH
ncbi:hypothetical protein TNCV_3053591 [Trichonephila clavipes]|uniref:Uncharacterized protein n=1 Tax=Trichonephila clavipes TaxID=2585209 RepID=A0A8X6S369_TRICX|nr:hypothetical protein TNCV_3053591 [Trichonephila clavipes]